MATFIIYSDGADAYVRSHHTAYLTARSGAALAVPGAATATTFSVGQDHDTKSGEYDCFEAFVSFDTSAVTGTPSSAALEMWVTQDNSTNDFTCNARVKDWSTSVDTGDWVAGASLTGLALRASKATAGVSVGAYNAFTSDASFVSNLTSPVRLLLCSSRHEAGTAPGSGEVEYLQFSTADATGTTQDPKLTIVTAGGSALSRAIADTITITDAVVRSSLARARALADTITIADTLARTVTEARSIADTVAIGDALARSAVAQSRTAGDTLTITDAVDASSIASLTRDIADTITIGDAITRVVSLGRGVADSVTIGDALARSAISFVRAIADTITITDSLARQVSTTAQVRSVTRYSAATRPVGQHGAGTRAVGQHRSGVNP